MRTRETGLLLEWHYHEGPETLDLLGVSYPLPSMAIIANSNARDLYLTTANNQQEVDGVTVGCLNFTK